MHIAGAHTASGLPWVARGDERTALAMAQQHGISELLAGILAGRHVALDHVPQFLNPTLRDLLPDPFHLKDMDKAAARIAKALQLGEKIAIFGDYDVDGATSSALLHHYLAPLGAKLRFYIPDRMKEGYGPNIAAFETLIDEGASLIITVDCGTMAHDSVAAANNRGVDVVILDHHLSSGALPAAHAIVNPNRVDETSPYTYLCAAGVTFLLLIALNKHLRDEGFFAQNHEPNLLALLDLVALGTVCDVMPLSGLNRALVAQGLKVMGQRNQPGLAALADVARLHEAPSTYHLGYVLGPRINAGGRVGESALGVKLLTGEDDNTLRAIATTLDTHNAERQAIEAGVREQATEKARHQSNAPVLVIAGEGWHPGVIGIVAGRLKEQFSRPAAVIALEGGIGKGSARSVPGADMGAAIHAAQVEGIITSGGGHAMAAGFTVPEGNIPALQQFLCDRLSAAVTAYGESRSRKLDGWLSVSAATAELIADIQQAAPFGLGNPSPRFGIKNARIIHRKVMKEQHLRLVLADDSGKNRLNAVAFNVGESQLGAWLATMPVLHLAGELSLNRWQGVDTPQFIIEDAAKPA
jgi:single-stranded-DNA-specific exonuclease